MKETPIVRKIAAHLKGAGFFVTKLHGSNMQRAGLPDLLAVKEGRAYFFEVKTEDGTVSRLQEHTIGQLRAVGAVAEVVRSVADVNNVLIRVESLTP